MRYSILICCLLIACQNKNVEAEYTRFYNGSWEIITFSDTTLTIKRIANTEEQVAIAKYIITDDTLKAIFRSPVTSMSVQMSHYPRNKKDTSNLNICVRAFDLNKVEPIEGVKISWKLHTIETSTGSNGWAFLKTYPKLSDTLIIDYKDQYITKLFINAANIQDVVITANLETPKSLKEYENKKVNFIISSLDRELILINTNRDTLIFDRVAGSQYY